MSLTVSKEAVDSCLHVVPVLCESPSGAAGELAVSVGVVGPSDGFSSGGVGMYRRGPVVSVRSVSPSVGGVVGGAVVVSSWDGGIAGLSGSSCRFGSVSPVAARSSSAGSVGGSSECASPSHSAGRVSVEVSSG